MTNFEKIKSMDDVELAMFLKDLEDGAVRDYKYGFLPKSAMTKLDWLRREVPEE